MATPAGAGERPGDAVIRLRPAEIVTLGARAALGPRRHAAAHVEPAQPVFTRYWLHNKGPAPTGYLPVAVHVHPAALRVVPGEEETVRVTVACSARSTVGLVELDVPDGWAAPPPGSLKYDLEAGEHAEFETVLRPPADAGHGTYFVAARIRDELGQTLEDVVTLTVGDPEPREPLTVTFGPAGLEVVPGGRATLTVELVNDARTEVRGEAQLLSPFGTWGSGAGEVLSGPWTQGFAVPAGGRVPLRFSVRAPGDARPGAHWWAAVKVSAFGRVHYTRTLPIEVRSLSGQYL